LNATAIRTDAHQRETVVQGNIVYKCGGGINCYNNNHAYNNICAFIEPGFDADGNKMKKSLYLAGDHGDYIDGIIQRNIIYLDKAADASANYTVYMKQDSTAKMQVDYNLIYFRDNPEKGKQLIAEYRENGYEQHSISEDPLFVNIDDGQFKLDPNSPAIKKLGFQQLDVTQMGLQDFPFNFDRSPEKNK
jgi:hypothetical protein